MSMPKSKRNWIDERLFQRRSAAAKRGAETRRRNRAARARDAAEIAQRDAARAREAEKRAAEARITDHNAALARYSDVLEQLAARLRRMEAPPSAPRAYTAVAV